MLSALNHSTAVAYRRHDCSASGFTPMIRYTTPSMRPVCSRV